jgi:uncharacterized membrane protein YhiD involved in acid resistance
LLPTSRQQVSIPVPSGSDVIELPDLLLHLAVGTVLALIMSWHFRRFGSTLANRAEFARVLPTVLLTTILIISVVKTSLALSLGMVGALSIVRFRTPIKEPEELAYLFCALAIGVGLGAQQTLETIVAAVAILTVMAVAKWARRDREEKSLYLSVDMNGAPAATSVEALAGIIGRHATTCDLRRFDLRDQGVVATFCVELNDTKELARMSEELRSAFPTIGISFLDQSRMPLA